MRPGRLAFVAQLSILVACSSGGGNTTPAPPPTPTLASGTFTPSTPVITGGTAPTISLPLPALTSAAASAATVTLTVSSGGPPVVVSKSGGGAVGAGDLGTAVTVSAPTTVETDAATFTYTLTVANAATPAATATATGSLTVVPPPALASSSITVAPAAITGGTALAISLPLPALASAVASAATVTLRVSSGGPPVEVSKGGGGAIGAADLGSTVTVDAPTTAATDAASFTYTLTVANAATIPATASASGTLAVVPAPALASSSITVAPAAIAGGSTPPISLPLPTLTSAAASAAAVTLTASSGGPPVVVSKSGDGAVGAGDLGTTVVVDAPTTVTTDAATFTYTLTVANAATTPASVSASGTLSVVPAGRIFLVATGTSGGLLATSPSPGPWSVTSTTGSTTAAPAVTGLPDVGLAVRQGAAASSNELEHDAWAPDAWGSWTRFGSGVSARSTPSIASSGSVATVVFQGPDFHHYAYTYSGGIWGAGPSAVGGASPIFGPTPPAVAVRPNGDTIVAYFASSTNRPTTIALVGGTWQSPADLGADTSTTASPAIVALASGPELMVAWVRQSDGNIMYATRTGGVWSAASAIAGASGVNTEQLALCSVQGGGAMLAYRGADGKLYWSAFNGSSWSTVAAFASPNPSVAAAPALATGVGTAAAENAFIESDGAAYHARYVSGAWTAPALVGGQNLAAIALGSSH